jgi:hypothetical protein
MSLATISPPSSPDSGRRSDFLFLLANRRTAAKPAKGAFKALILKTYPQGCLLVLKKFGKIDFGVLTVLLGGVYIPAQRGRGAAGGC